MIALPLILLYRLITKYPVLVVLFYTLPFTAQMFNEEVRGEEFEERIEVVLEIEEDDSERTESDIISFNQHEIAETPEYTVRIEDLYKKSSHFRLYDLRCQWLVDMDLVLI